jgi:antitoxin ParD1/3/4
VRQTGIRDEPGLAVGAKTSYFMPKSKEFRMIEKMSISLTEEHARLVKDAVASGDYASSSEVIREALRDWKTKRLLGQLWDEGLASGRSEPGETIEDIEAEGRRRHGAA